MPSQPPGFEAQAHPGANLGKKLIVNKNSATGTVGALAKFAKKKDRDELKTLTTCSIQETTAIGLGWDKEGPTYSTAFPAATDLTKTDNKGADLYTHLSFRATQ